MSISYQLHEKGQRPWGEWEVISLGVKHIVKKITVNPHASLSLQMHHHRGEHWVITDGRPTVTIDDNKQELRAGKAVDIPKGAKHRLENFTDEPVQLIEVQIGDILDERDIVRFEDKYNRLTT
ncbi:MAG: phosphomannose isomerase type II C-terminal cupin domain, partial [Alphaproteobacteria bacterium]|nr:phosphomannose isomerase type II C-terminal cupin domain [Alphaproteobacteria bacterium]